MPVKRLSVRSGGAGIAAVALLTGIASYVSTLHIEADSETKRTYPNTMQQSQDLDSSIALSNCAASSLLFMSLAGLGLRLDPIR